MHIHVYKKKINIIVEAFLHIIASTCMSSLDALMFYKGAQNDFSRKLYAWPI